MKRLLCLWLPPRAPREADTAKNGWGLAPPAENSAHQLLESTSSNAHPSAPLVELACWCERFSPLVGIEGADCVILDITGSARVFGGEAALATQLLRDLAPQPIPELHDTLPLIGLADTLGAAWAVARTLAHLEQPLVVIPPGQTAPVLAPLPVATLRLPLPLLTLLHELGLTQIGQVLALPRRELPARFGQELLTRVEQVLGERDEVLRPVRPLPDWTVRWALEYPLSRWDGIQYILEQLLLRLCQELQQQEQGVLRLACRLRCLNRQRVEVEIGVFRPTAQSQHLRELLQLRLETVRLPAPLEEVEIQAMQLAPLAERQTELFTQTTQEQPLALAQLLERLQCRLGEKTVQRARLLAESQPERAYRLSTLTGAPSRRNHTANTTVAPGPLRRPLHLWLRPILVRVVAVAPTGPPAMWHLAGECQQIVRSWGPERIETGWWRGRTVRRDYYRVETADAAWWWMFRELHSGQWFLHGEFA